VTGSSLALYAWRAPRIGLGARFKAVSRESFLLVNNVILAAACGTVLLGTLYPLGLDALGLGKISVGPPYFETVFVPLMVLLLLFTGIGPLTRWRETRLADLARPAAMGAGVSMLAALALAAAVGEIRPLPVLGLFVACWIVSMMLIDLARWQRQAGWRRLPRATAGMMLAHLGVAVFALGVTMVRSYEIERDQRLMPGQTVEVGGHTFRFVGVRESFGPNFDALVGEIEVMRDGRVLDTLHPEKRVYRVQRNPMTEAAIQPGLTGDLYASLGESLGGGAWSVRLYIKPFVDWIWCGCGLMALGGALAASDRRYRARAPEVEGAGGSGMTQGARS
jgi:cytochrome c-type biogenesis protein CcmF